MTRTTAMPVSTKHLTTTTLAELNSAAGLLTRVDRKYLVPLESAHDLVDGLAPHAQVLAIDERRRFSYASTYFDTPELDAFMLTARKRRRRFKVRTRTYLDSGLCFLEVKTCGARGTTVKRRMGYHADDAFRLTGPGRAFVTACLASTGVTGSAAAHEVAWAGDLMRGLAEGRPWVLMEQAPSAVQWRGRNSPKRPGQLLLWSLARVAHGADGILQFQWRQSRRGAETFHSGMVPHAGRASRTWDEVVDTGRALKRLGPVLGEPVRAEAAVVLDWESQWALSTAIGPVDIMAKDAEGRSVAVEIKRVGGIDGVEQLTRYLELLDRDPLLTPVQGVFAAQTIKPQARVLAEDRGIRCVTLDYDAMRGMDDPTSRLF